MPIFDIQAKAEATFPKLGTIRKGAKKTANAPGKDLTHFRLDDATDVAEVYQALYCTTEPQEMGIFLPFDDLDRVFRAYHELYSAGTLLCQGDGKQVRYMRNPQTGQLLARDGYARVDFQVGQVKFTIGEAIPCPGMAHGLYPHCAKCKPHGYLMAIIPEVKRFGYYEFKTTSYYDILNLTGNLRAIMALNNGRLTGVPLVVRRTPQQIPTPGADGKRTRREKWLLSIEAAPGWVDMMQRRWNTLEGEDAPVAMLTNGHAEEEGDDPDAPEGEFIGAEGWEEDGDDETGEIVQPSTGAGAKASTQAVAQANADPDMLDKARAYFAATNDDGEPASDKQVQLLASKLGEAIGGRDDTERYLFLEQVCGVSSTSELGKKQASKLLDFLLVKDTYNLNPESVQKVQALMRQARLAQGQQELLLDARPADVVEAGQEV